MKKEKKSTSEEPQKKVKTILKKSGLPEGSPSGPGLDALESVRLLWNSISNEWHEPSGLAIEPFRHSYLLRSLIPKLQELATKTQSVNILILFSKRSDGDILRLNIYGEQSLQKLDVYTIISSLPHILGGSGFLLHGIEYSGRLFSWMITMRSMDTIMPLAPTSNEPGLPGVR